VIRRLAQAFDNLKCSASVFGSAGQHFVENGGFNGP
jgi:hypothetical protein